MVQRHYVPAYSCIYGRHPATFNFGSAGEMLPIRFNDNGLILRSTQPRAFGDSDGGPADVRRRDQGGAHGQAQAGSQIERRYRQTESGSERAGG